MSEIHVLCPFLGQPCQKALCALFVPSASSCPGVCAISRLAHLAESFPRELPLLDLLHALMKK